MPFIPSSRRPHAESGNLSEWQPGDFCYLHYKRMVDAWRKERRWTTAHNLYKEMIKSRPYKDWDNTIAEELAWQVFFQLHVMPYELEKQQENGDI